MKNTLLSAMGFEDHDLKTPGHDQIMLWVDANADEVAAQVWGFFELHKDSSEKQMVRNCTWGAIRFVRVVKKTWERPVLSGRPGFARAIGFVDMSLICEGVLRREGYDQETSVEICVEVKSAIKSVGELIRQVRAYGGAYFVVVCPDDRFAEVIRSQGIGFVKCPSFSSGRAGELF